MVRVKICGITSLADARTAIDAGAFAIGLNFHPSSPRRVEIAQARAISDGLPSDIWRVGVFVDRDRGAIEQIVREAGLTALQFHGNETPEFCRGWDVPVIKVVRARVRSDVDRLRAYPVELVLVDAYVEGTPGGTGERFDWSLLDGFERERLILSGGLNPDNVAEAVRTVGPWAVDVASGVESRPGVKDPEKVKRFIRDAQAA